MFSKRHDSLRVQLLLWLLIPLLLLFVFNAWLSNQAAVAVANGAFDRLLSASAEAIAEDVEVQDGAIKVDLPYAALQLLESNMQERIFYRVVAPDGKTITGYDDLPMPTRAMPAGDESLPYRADYRGEPVYLVALSKQLYGAALAAPVTIIVAETGEARQALSHRIVADALLRQSLLIAAAAVLVWYGLVRGLRPLERLRASIAARPTSDLAPIEAAGVPSEVRTLISALNHHTARIERLQSGRQQLIADASHQMRTPLAEIRTQIEYTLRQSDPVLLRQTLTDVHADVSALGQLLSQLLLLARSDPDASPDQRIEPLDLGRLVQSTTLEFVAAARRREIDIAYDAPAQRAEVLGNPLLLRELIGNLLDNAMQHGRHGGHVVARVIADYGVALEVEDDGPGVPEVERARVFERFFRGKGRESSGSGLGLAIVRNIAESHQARIDLRVGSGGAGLCVRVTFQAAPQIAPGTTSRAPAPVASGAGTPVAWNGPETPAAPARPRSP